jgi:hypothetical protein
MMRNIALGLAAATIAIGGSTMSASAIPAKICKGTFYESGASRLTPRERQCVRAILRELAELTPRERAYLRGVVRERLAQRERLHRHGPYGLR